ncbi:unnamed protein product [Heterobilharzia americana]|nr:unnamed protein product [Heterobilharzia americana]
MATGPTCHFHTYKKLYTNLYHELFQDINFPIGYQMMISSKHQSDMIKDPQNVPEILCVHSSNLLSVKQLIYKTSGYFRNAFPDHSPILTYEEGDGTVNMASLSVCKNWTNSKHIVIPGVLHDEMVLDKYFIKLVVDTVGAKINYTSRKKNYSG